MVFLYLWLSQNFETSNVNPLSKGAKMTNFDIFAQIISEASGKPLDEVKQMSDVILKMAGSSGKMHEEVPEEKTQNLLTKLRGELPGVRRWLVEGGLMVEADIAAAKGKMN